MESQGSDSLKGIGYSVLGIGLGPEHRIPNTEYLCYFFHGAVNNDTPFGDHRSSFG